MASKLFSLWALPMSVTLAVRLGIVVPLSLACVFVVVAIPVAAWRGKLFKPVYGGLAIAAALIGLLLGRLAGAQGVRGTPLGIFVSVLFFLLVAAAAGSFLGLFLYRYPPQN